MRPYLDGKKKICVRYEWATEANRAETERAGRPIHDQVLMAYVSVIGSRDEFPMWVERTTPDGKVRINEAKLETLGETWAAFQKAREGATVETGTPLEAWPALDARQAADLKAINIYTVDTLAGVSDAVIQKLGIGGRELVARAKAFIDQASGAADIEKYAAENARLKAEIDQLKAQIEQLGKGKAA